MSRKGWALFVLVSALWGIPYLLIKVAVDEVAPSVLVVARCGLATLVLAPLAWRRGVLGSLRGRLRSVLALAVVQIVGPFLLIASGEQRVSSSLAGLLIAVQPVFVALLALRFVRTERVGGLRLVGLACGLGGVVALLGLDTTLGAYELVGAGMVLVASLGYAAAALLIRRLFDGVPPLAPVTATLAIATAVLLPVAAVQAPARVPGAGASAAIVALGLACTAAGLLAFYALIAEAGASRASLINYAATAVAVGLGVAFLSERFGVSTGAGFALVAGGCWLATGGRLSTGALTARRLWRRKGGRLPQGEKRRDTTSPAGRGRSDV